MDARLYLYLNIVAYTLLCHSITNHYTKETVTERGLPTSTAEPIINTRTCSLKTLTTTDHLSLWHNLL